MNGTYSEPLGQGELKVTADEWWIEYYFSGPDLRYSGEFLRVKGDRVAVYVEALRANFERYLSLIGTVPDGAKLEIEGAEGMSIRVGDYREGVCLVSYHHPISTPEAGDQFTALYEYAQCRAPEIQKMLKELSRP